MMLKGQSGRIATGFGWLPAGASQVEKRVAAVDSSSAIQGTPIRSRTGASSPATAASTKNRRASALAAMSAMVCGVDEGASGATAMPARRRRGRRRHIRARCRRRWRRLRWGVCRRAAGSRRHGPSSRPVWRMRRGARPRSGPCVAGAAGAGADQLAVVGEGAGEQLAETHSILGGPGSRRRYMP
jgi:hypothetical protein